MKLSELYLPDESEERELLDELRDLNRTAAPYPRDKTTHGVFSEAAARWPDNAAVAYGGSRLTYAELERRSNALAHFLIRRGVRPEEFVGLMLERSHALVVALLGVLKAGAAYVPLSDSLPYERARYILEDTRARVLLSERRHIRALNRLQWDCRELDTFVCLDTRDVHAEIEGAGGMMAERIWEHVASEAFDDISGGGWTSSYTGEWLSREVMDEYGDNILRKLAPLLTPETRVLEIGCASGISMFRIAPRVGLYFGTDLSPGIIRRDEEEVRRRGLGNVRLAPLAAHEVGRVGAKDFDVVILNSVIECFAGHNYLRDVLRKSIDLMGDDGYIFLGNVWDQETKDLFVRSLVEFKRRNPERGRRTKTDRSEELFISRDFLEDLRADFPEIADIEFSKMLGTAESELSLYGYDALVRISKRGANPPARPRRKHQFDARALDAMPETAPPERSDPGGLAYMMYTSGTSGRPKGVMVEHRSVLRLVVNTNYIEFRPEDRVLQTGDLGFDASTLEIWGPLLNGGCVVLPSGKDFLGTEELTRLVREGGVTVMWLTAGLFNQVVDRDVEVFRGLRVLLTGGEKGSPRRFNLVREAHPTLALINGYGPTENTTFTTCHEAAGPLDRDVPIGRPVSNTTVYVLDESHKPVPVGAQGELCAGGDGLARGYWNDPALTALKFIPNPFEPGARLYRTGDLARWTRGGVVEFLGRLDAQLKVRGHRVEPGEVEACLLRHELVREAAVVAKDLGRGGDELVAYVAGAGGPGVEELREHARRSLPEVMVPSHFVTLERLPLNANGKVDRARLPEPGVARGPRADYAAPSTPTERRLAAIWERVLGHDRVGATSDFFDLGGHSLKLDEVVTLVRKELGVRVPLSVVFTAPTVRELAHYVDDVGRIDSRIVEDRCVPLNRGGAGAGKVFALPPGSGYCLSYQRLAALVPCAFYGLGFPEGERPLEEYARWIREVDAEGPYVLFGFSGGGKLAFGVAQELERAGARVAGVVIMDAARYLREISFSDEEVRRVAEEFLRDVRSRALRERAYARMRRYRKFLGGLVEEGAVAADIHLVRSARPAEVADESTGEPVATLSGWRGLTRGRFETYDGSGEHREMLDPPHLERNAELLTRILASIARGEAARGQRR